MRNFSYKKPTSSRQNPSASNAIMDEIAALNPEEIAHNIHYFMNEVQYSCKSSVESVHPNLVYLSDACKNVGAIVMCLPLLTRDNKMASILSNPEMITHLPNIDPRNVALHFNTIVEAAKIYLGTHDEKISNSDIAKQMFSLLGQLLSQNEDKGVLERTGKLFARTVNDQLHIIFPLDENGKVKEPTTDTENKSQ